MGHCAHGLHLLVDVVPQDEVFSAMGTLPHPERWNVRAWPHGVHPARQPVPRGSEGLGEAAHPRHRGCALVLNTRWWLGRWGRIGWRGDGAPVRPAPGIHGCPTKDTHSTRTAHAYGQHTHTHAHIHAHSGWAGAKQARGDVHGSAGERVIGPPNGTQPRTDAPGRKPPPCTPLLAGRSD